MMEDNLIVLENGLGYLSKEEYIELEKMLSKHEIILHSFENRGPKASLNDISIYISQHITELLITSLMMPAVYDTIKSFLKFVVFRIKEKVKILQSRKIREAIPCINFKTINGEIIAPIPSTLSEQQFDRYMDEIRFAIETIKPNPEKDMKYS